MSFIFLVVIFTFTLQQSFASPSGCCDFDSSACTYPVGAWMPIGTFVPPPTEYTGFARATNFLYLYDAAAQVEISSTISITDASSIISYDYYYYTETPADGSYLHIFFQPTGTSYRALVAEIQAPLDQWLTGNFACNDPTNSCCGSLSASCTGSFIVIGQLTNLPQYGLFGIDNIGTCEDHSVCCTMASNTATDCNFVNSLSNIVPWVYSDYELPSNLPPPTTSGTSYAYLDYASYSLSTPLDSEFVSEEFSILADAVFQLSVYVDTVYPAEQVSGLYFSFRETVTGRTTNLAFYTYSISGDWESVTPQCDYATYDCCIGQPSCSGRLVLTAHVEGSPLKPETVFFGVDAIQRIGDSCTSPFPFLPHENKLTNFKPIQFSARKNIY